MIKAFMELGQTLRTLSWSQFDWRFAPIFVAYGLIAGLLGTSHLNAASMLGGIVGSLLGGYLLPGRKLAVSPMGPFAMQLLTGVVCALIGAAIAAALFIK